MIPNTVCTHLPDYANYVRFFERAAYDWLGASACGALMRSQGLLLGVEALDGLKYADAALLGDACEVRGAFTGLVDGVLSLRVALVRAADPNPNPNPNPTPSPSPHPSLGPCRRRQGAV